MKSRSRGHPLVFLVFDREGFKTKALKYDVMFDIFNGFSGLNSNIPNHLVEIVVLDVGALFRSNPDFINLIPAGCAPNSLFDV